VILVLDTSTDHCVLALASGSPLLSKEGAGGWSLESHVIAEDVFPSRRTLSQMLLGRLDALLAGQGKTLADIDAFAVGVGPGSFTGLRVGVTTMKMFAQALALPLVGVPSFDGYPAAEGQGVAVVPLLPSRRGEVYGAVYRDGVVVAEPFAESHDDLRARIAALLVHGPVTAALSAPLYEELFAGWALASDVAHAICDYPSPEHLARSAFRILGGSADSDPRALTPAYVAPPVITTPRDPSILGRSPS